MKEIEEDLRKLPTAIQQRLRKNITIAIESAKVEADAARDHSYQQMYYDLLDQVKDGIIFMAARA
jgi:hypothetical protein